MSWSELRRSRPVATICVREGDDAYRFEFVERTETALGAGYFVVVLDVRNLRFDCVFGKQVAHRLVVDLQNAHSDVKNAVHHLDVKWNKENHIRHRCENVVCDQRQKASK